MRVDPNGNDTRDRDQHTHQGDQASLRLPVSGPAHDPDTAGTVDHDRHQRDRQASHQCTTQTHGLEPFEYISAQPFPANDRADDDRGKRQHDHLVQSGQQRGPGCWNLHVPALLARRATGDLRELDNRLRRASQGKRGDTCHWRHGIDDQRHQPGDRSEAEEHHDQH
ncbi:hypothetical protein D3C87_1645680 [compost metagenome]